MQQAEKPRNATQNGSACLFEVRDVEARESNAAAAATAQEKTSTKSASRMHTSTGTVAKSSP